jgi:fatty-acyl-CoA synthase
METGFSYKHTVPSTPFRYETIPDRIQHWANVSPDKEAYVFVGMGGKRRAITCAELYSQSARCARGLVKLGVSKGDIVSMIIPNSIEGLVCNFGVLLAGAIAYNIGFSKTDGSDVVSILRKLGDCTTLIVNPGKQDSNWKICHRIIEGIFKDGTATSSNIPSLKYLISTASPQDQATPGLSLDTLLSTDSSDSEAQLPILDPDDVAVLFSTSGSTGTPKAVSHSHFSILEGSTQMFGTAELTADDRYYNDRIMAWLMGYPLAFLHCGLTTVSTEWDFDTMDSLIAFTMAAIDDERCNATFFHPAEVHGAVQYIEQNGISWKIDLLMVGGLPIGSNTANAVKKIANKMLIIYGTSEVFPSNIWQCRDLSTLRDFIEYTGGYPLPGTESKIIDDDGHIVRSNIRGNICVRTPVMFQHYYNQPQETSAVLMDSGWFKTADVGYMTEDGLVVCEGRQSDQIVCGGAIVYPTLIESHLRKCPGVADVMVVGVPDVILFQQICACLIPKQGCELLPDDVRAFCEEQYVDQSTTNLVAGVLPKYYLLFEAFPTVQSGKVSRRLLAHEAARRLK